MIDLTSEQVNELRAELPEMDYDWILNRIETLKSDPGYRGNAALVVHKEWLEMQEVQLINLALRRYGSHD